MKRMSLCILIIALLTMTACGGGGGGGSNTNTGPTTAVITLSTQGSLSGNTMIGGLGVTVNLPAGMNVKTDTNGNVDTTVLATTGVAQGQATIIVLYTAATSTAQAKLYVALSSNSAAGFAVGEFAKANCGIDAGKNPQASGISLTNFQVVDTNGAVISGVTPTFSAAMQ